MMSVGSAGSILNGFPALSQSDFVILSMKPLVLAHQRRYL